MYEGTNVRSGPSTSSAIVKRTGKGESYPIVSTKGDWYEIKLSNGDSAYVASWVVQTVDQAGSAGDSKAQHRLWQSGQAREAQSKIKRLSSMPDMEDMTAGQSERGDARKRLTIKTATLLAAKLRADGVNVYMTRNDDSFVSLQSRVATSHYRNADAFISIHYDSFPNASVREIRPITTARPKTGSSQQTCSPRSKGTRLCQAAAYYSGTTSY